MRVGGQAGHGLRFSETNFTSKGNPDIRGAYMDPHFLVEDGLRSGLNGRCLRSEIQLDRLFRARLILGTRK